MKDLKTSLFLVLFVLRMLLTPSAFGEEPPLSEPKGSLLASADQDIFVRNAFAQDYSEDQGYVNELPNPKTIHQYFIFDGVGTDRLISMLPAEESVRTTNKRLSFSQVRKDEFHVTYSVMQSENVPEYAGGRCWIRYSNVVLLGEGKESGVILFPGGQAYFFSPGANGLEYKSIADLSSLDPYTRIKFDFIRLDQTMYVYADGVLLFTYRDGIGESVSFEAGAELYKGSCQVRCDFDDFSMRIK